MIKQKVFRDLFPVTIFFIDLFEYDKNEWIKSRVLIKNGRHVTSQKQLDFYNLIAKTYDIFNRKGK